MKYIGFDNLQESIIDTSTIKSFEDLKGKNIDPIMLQNYINSIPIKLQTTDGNRKFKWPEEVFSSKSGNCVEMSVMLKYYFDSIKYQSIPVYIMAANTRTGEVLFNHMTLLCMYENRYWWSFNLVSIGFFTTKLEKDFDKSLLDIYTPAKKSVQFSVGKENADYIEVAVIPVIGLNWELIDSHYGDNINQKDLLSKTNIISLAEEKIYGKSLMPKSTKLSKKCFKDIGTKYVDLMVMEMRKRKNGK